MKINRIASLVKASKTIITTSHNKTLWVSDGWVGWYPLFEMPDNLGEESIFALFDIAEDARGKYQFTIGAFPEGFAVKDDCPGEVQIQERCVSIYLSGKRMQCFFGSLGLEMISVDALKPFSDLENVSFFERLTPAGMPYIAVKAGLILVGLLTPMLINREETVDELRKMSEQAGISLYNANQINGTAKQEYKQEEIDFEEDED